MTEDEASRANPGTRARFSLVGKRALVTGAGLGLGRVIELALAEAGADVAISVREASTLASVAEEMRGLGRLAEPVMADLAEPGAPREVVAAAGERLGALEVVVASAGISSIWKRGTGITEEEWDGVFALNTRATFFLCAEAGRRMADGAGGSIITMASVTALSAAPRMAAYSASKAAIIQFTRTLAVELVDRQVRVNALAPGYIETDMTCDLLRHQYWGPEIHVKILLRRGSAGGDHRAWRSTWFHQRQAI